MKIAVFFSFITGVMVGGEYVEDDGLQHLVLDLFIVRICITWGDLDLELDIGED